MKENALEFGEYEPASREIKGFKLINAKDVGDLEQRAEHLGTVESWGQVGVLEGECRNLISFFVGKGTITDEEKALRDLRKQGLRRGANVAVIRRAGVYPDEIDNHVYMKADLYKA